MANNDKTYPTKDELVAAVKKHALENYGNGWDVVVECYEDAEILEVIGRSWSINGAIKKVGIAIGAWNAKRREIESTAW